jgi:dTDP-4-dehydrorhamnose reductase
MNRPRYKVAVIGATGLLGRCVSKELAGMSSWEVVRTGHRRGNANTVALDIRDHRAIDRFFSEHTPNAVVVCAAERRPDVCEHDPDTARALNVDALRAIAHAAQGVDAWVLGLSTDYIFDGTQPPYQVDDHPNPLNAYGHSKLDGERTLLGAISQSCVLRVPLLYGPVEDWSESAVTVLIPAVQAASGSSIDAPATMDAWATRYPTYTPDVAIVIRQLLERHENGNALTGICQWSGDEPMTKFEMAQRIATAMNVTSRLVPQLTPIDDTPRPRDCHLSSSVLESLGIGQRTPFDTAIKEVLAVKNV